MARIKARAPSGLSKVDYHDLPPSAYELALDRERDAKRKQRTCLACGKPFDSHGPGNRRCKPCASRLDHRLRNSGSPYEPDALPDASDLSSMTPMPR